MHHATSPKSEATSRGFSLPTVSWPPKKKAFAAICFLGLCFEAYSIVRANYVSTALPFVLAAFLLLLKIKRVFILFLVLFIRVLLDSIPVLTYKEIAYSLSFLDFYTLFIMAYMSAFLLQRGDFLLDSISKTMALVLLPMSITSIYHTDLKNLIEIGSLWIYFLLTYHFFCHVVSGVPKITVYKIIFVISLYPLLNQILMAAQGQGFFYAGYMRFFGSFDHPVKISFCLALAVPAAVFLFMNAPRSRTKWFLGLAIAFFHVGVYLTHYRTAWISLLGFWFFYIALYVRRRLLSLLPALALAFLLIQFHGEVLTDRLAPIKTFVTKPGILFDFENYQYNDLFTGRIAIWKAGLDAYFHSEFPDLLVGLGLNSMSKISYTYMHNEFLSALVETGIFGFAGILTWVVVVSACLLSARNEGRRHSLFVFSAFILFLTAALGTMPFRNISIMNYMALYMACATSRATLPAQIRPAPSHLSVNISAVENVVSIPAQSDFPERI